MDIILQADAIRPPLTGLGRYALELAHGLRNHSGINCLRLFGDGDWLSMNRVNGFATPVHQNGRLRAWLAGNPLAVRIYEQTVPRLAAWRLRNEGHSLYHAPNFLLPPFPGPAVATIHDLSHEILPHTHPDARISYMQRALPDTLARARHLITDSNAVRGEIIRHYSWPQERISVVPLGVSPLFRPHSIDETTDLLQRHGLRHGSYALYVGTIEPRKNILRLLQAYGGLASARHKAMPLVLAGGMGWKSDEVLTLMNQARAAGWARYLSYVPEADLPALYAGARFFVYPSLYEGFGLPILEAMASGVPVLTSACSSMPEVAGDAGLLVPPQDVDALRQALEQLIDDDALCTRLGQLGRERSQLFNWQRCVDQTVTVYHKVLQQA